VGERVRPAAAHRRMQAFHCCLFTQVIVSFGSFALKRGLAGGTPRLAHSAAALPATSASPFPQRLV
jgi:hypothetical protein